MKPYTAQLAEGDEGRQLGLLSPVNFAPFITCHLTNVCHWSEDSETGVFGQR